MSCQSCTIALSAAVAIAGASAVSAPASPAEKPPIREAKDESPSNVGLAGYAKLLCSAVFLTGMPDDAAREHSRRVAADLFKLPAADLPSLTDVVDRRRKLVRATLRGSRTRTARLYGDQGCVTHPDDHDGIYFKPVPVRTKLAPADSRPWPDGDGPPEALPTGGDPAKLRAALELAFAPPARTTALVVVHRGHLVAERYAAGVDRHTLLEGWSMGKSLTATLLGRLMMEGGIRLEDPAPVPEWQGAGDPRGRIRLADLLRMSSGLDFSLYEVLDKAPGGGVRAGAGYPDHYYVYAGGIDAFRYSLSRQLRYPPGTVGRYRNCDPLVVGAIVKRGVTARGEEYLTWPQRALFDPIGIRRMVLETDAYGDFLLCALEYGAARDWARIGLLYLQEGVWQGKRLLPQSFVEFVRTPAPGWSNEEGKPTQSRYGGFWWLNTSGRYVVPSDAFFAAGAGGQTVLVVPSLQLVVARLTDYDPVPPPEGSERSFNAALRAIVAALPR